eukprot:CAMPEP_0180030726 /NCGR_PEP_ID=MMETSP0984-20121128/27543_1 /TAXON_ID=483367 /ORGANISM="non described non described, Strain CCMP 2436" /LENGTH=161 /DNA_ID=CAMNT_0021955845 /DNA_START=669 /DNA_END=1153 /DNA_ORIENTATION=+
MSCSSTWKPDSKYSTSISGDLLELLLQVVNWHRKLKLGVARGARRVDPGERESAGVLAHDEGRGRGAEVLAAIGKVAEIEAELQPALVHGGVAVDVHVYVTVGGVEAVGASERPGVVVACGHRVARVMHSRIRQHRSESVGVVRSRCNELQPRADLRRDVV